MISNEIHEYFDSKPQNLGEMEENKYRLITSALCMSCIVIDIPAVL